MSAGGYDRPFPPSNNVQPQIAHNARGSGIDHSSYPKASMPYSSRRSPSPIPSRNDTLHPPYDDQYRQRYNEPYRSRELNTQYDPVYPPEPWMSDTGPVDPNWSTRRLPSPVRSSHPLYQDRNHNNHSLPRRDIPPPQDERAFEPSNAWKHSYNHSSRSNSHGGEMNLPQSRQQDDIRRRGYVDSVSNRYERYREPYDMSASTYDSRRPSPYGQSLDTYGRPYSQSSESFSSHYRHHTEPTMSERSRYYEPSPNAYTQEIVHRSVDPYGDKQNSYQSTPRPLYDDRQPPIQSPTSNIYNRGRGSANGDYTLPQRQISGSGSSHVPYSESSNSYRPWNRETSQGPSDLRRSQYTVPYTPIEHHASGPPDDRRDLTSRKFYGSSQAPSNYPPAHHAPMRMQRKSSPSRSIVSDGVSEVSSSSSSPRLKRRKLDYAHGLYSSGEPSGSVHTSNFDHDTGKSKQVDPNTLPDHKSRPPLHRSPNHSHDTLAASDLIGNPSNEGTGTAAVPPLSVTPQITVKEVQQTKSASEKRSSSKVRQIADLVSHDDEPTVSSVLSTRVPTPAPSSIFEEQSLPNPPPDILDVTPEVRVIQPPEALDDPVPTALSVPTISIERPLTPPPQPMITQPSPSPRGRPRERAPLAERPPNVSIDPQTLREGLRIAVAARQKYDTQTRDQRVNPILISNLSLVDPPSRRKVTSPEDVICEVEKKRRGVMKVTEKVRSILMKSLAKEKESIVEKAERLKKEYLALHEKWVANCLRLDEASKPAGITEEAAVTTGRTTRRSAATLGDAVRSDLEMEQIIASLGNEDLTDPNHLAVRNVATIPDMISVTQGEVKYAYDDTNGFVADPAAFYDPRSGLFDWSADEEQIFYQKYGEFPKQFGIISTFLPNKTTAQCVLYYYLHKKRLADFRNAISQSQGKRRRGARKSGKQKSNALLTDIQQRDKEIPRRGTRRRRAAAVAASQTGGEKGLTFRPSNYQTEATPEVEGRPKRRRTNVQSLAEPDDDVSMDTDPAREPVKKARRGRKPKVVEGDRNASPLQETKFIDNNETLGRRKPTTHLWSEDDKQTFIDLLSRHGKNFKRIAASMPNKTTMQVTNYYRNHHQELGLDVIAALAASRSPSEEATPRDPFTTAGQNNATAASSVAGTRGSSAGDDHNMPNSSQAVRMIPPEQQIWFQEEYANQSSYPMYPSPLGPGTTSAIHHQHPKMLVLHPSGHTHQRSIMPLPPHANFVNSMPTHLQPYQHYLSQPMPPQLQFSAYKPPTDFPFSNTNLLNGDPHRLPRG